MLLILAWTGALLGPFLGWWLWRRRNPVARTLLAALAVFYVLGVWAFLVEPQVLVVRHVTVTSAQRRWPCGLYAKGSGKQLYVTGGVGGSILPVRFRAPPEIVIVTLRGPP